MYALSLLRDQHRHACDGSLNGQYRAMKMNEATSTCRGEDRPRGKLLLSQFQPTRPQVPRAESRKFITTSLNQLTFVIKVLSVIVDTESSINNGLCGPSDAAQATYCL